ncbi:MAG: hypothetical protein DMD96_02650 [Candidatus Rokuibacteriota bacterium]|nr:MAG: hypothetical protein DMD96_02650 [Candidatus Rokubacteria bacterium]
MHSSKRERLDRHRLPSTRTHRGRSSACTSPACRLRASRISSTGREAPRACHSSRRTEKEEIGAVKLTQFLSSLAQQDHVAASTQNQALSAPLFLRLAAGVHRVIDHARPCQV